MATFKSPLRPHANIVHALKHPDRGFGNGGGREGAGQVKAADFYRQ
ncbi:hypothetical protein V5F53_02900 [Xanthobacter sp. V4C-4]